MVNLNMSKYSIITLDEVNSTNAYALENFHSLSDCSVISTSHQNYGRGRYNRKWISDDSENIYVTFVLKVHDVNKYPIANLTQYLSVVVCELLEDEFKLKPEIKWPNDILVNGGKISGILAESYMENNRIQGVVLGLGLNVNLKKETIEKIDQKAVSLSVLKNQNYNVVNILNELVERFFVNYNEFIQKGFSYIKSDYISRCAFLGKNITIRELNKEKKYLAKSIDEEGFLIVNDELNKEYRIMTGDVLC